jgi:hypothetical protein
MWTFVAIVVVVALVVVPLILLLARRTARRRRPTDQARPASEPRLTHPEGVDLAHPPPRPDGTAAPGSRPDREAHGKP